MVDILLATYNGEKFIKDQINSILEQNYDDWHLIIRDDNSQDNTVNILKNYQLNHPTKIDIHIDKIGTGSAKENFFKLMKLSKSEYIMFCDQDDLWLQDKISVCLNGMIELEKTCRKQIPLLVHSDLTVVDQQLNLISPSLFQYQKLNYKRDRLNNLLCQNIVTGCTMLINKTLLNAIIRYSNFDNMNDCIMHDWWCALIAASLGKIKFIDKSTILYRQHNYNQIGAKNISSIKYIIKKLLKERFIIQKNINDTYKQTQLFLNLYEEDLITENIKILSSYINIQHNNKINKIINLYKYGFIKYGFFRAFGHLLFV